MELNDTAIKRTALLVTALSSFITPFMGSSINIALPSIGRELSMNAVLLNWVSTSYLLTTAMLLIPFGRLADIHGRKRIFIYGLAIFSVSSLLSAFSTSAFALMSFRVMQGVGGAMLYGTGVAILISVYGAKDRGKALGINTAATYTGLSLGPFLGGIMTQQFGWRSIFIANMALGLVTLALALWRLKGEWAEARKEKFDYAGSIIYAFMLLAITYGFSLLPAGKGLMLIGFGLLGIVAFINWELRVKSPILNMNIFANNIVFALSNLAALINYSATFGIGFLLSLYLQYTRGLTPQHAGFILVSQPIIMAAFSPLAGRLSDRIEPRVISSIGMALSTLGLALFALLDEKTPMGFIIAALIIIGFGFAFFSSPNVNAVMSSVERRFYGVASATLSTMRVTGQTLGMAIIMLIFAVFIGKVQITPEYYGLFLKSMKVAFIISAILCFGGVFASLARGKVRA